jgi:hypothetical protein
MVGTLSPSLFELQRTLCPPYDFRARRTQSDARYFDNTGSGGTLSFGASACMVISVIETRS